jgi:lipoyl synthase
LKITESIQLMKLKHCVITSVDRDELPDKGVAHWAETVLKIKELNPNTIIELLIPDYNEIELQPIVDAKPDIIAHNLETVKRLTPTVRSKATYDKSLDTLKAIVKSGLVSKTGIMVGLGETQEEVIDGCQMITIGQYLQPTIQNIEVAEYVTPEVFEKYKEVALSLGFESVESAPLVRSSYMAERSFLKKIEENR